MSRFKKKREIAERDISKPCDLTTDATLSTFPIVCDYLTVDQYDDGKPRITATLLLFCEDGLLKGCLSDRDSDRVVFKQGDTLFDVLSSMERGLDEDTIDWRRSNKGKNKKRWS